MLPVIGKTYLYLSTAKNVLEVVKDAYSDGEDSSQIFEIKSRLWQMRQGESEVINYYMEMLSLVKVEPWFRREMTGDSIRYPKKIENREDLRVFGQTKS